MQQPTPPVKRKPLGAAISWSDTHITELAIVTSADRQAAAALWQSETTKPMSATPNRVVVDTVIDATTAHIRDVAQLLIDGKFTLAQWQSAMQTQLKALYVACGVAACGGFSSMDSGDYATLGTLIAAQFTYLRNMVADIVSGKQPLDGTLLQRVALYAQAARCIYEAMAMEQAQDNGKTEARRVLGLADHCTGCVTQAAKGWQAMSAIVPIGGTECLSNCRCTLQFR